MSASSSPEIHVTARHTTLTEAIKSYAVNKLDSGLLDFPKVIHAHIILDVEKFRQTCEVVVQCSGHHTFEAEHESDNMYTSIDLCMDKIFKQMVRYKKKNKEQRHHLRDKETRRGKHGLPVDV